MEVAAAGWGRAAQGGAGQAAGRAAYGRLAAPPEPPLRTSPARCPVAACPLPGRLQVKQEPGEVIVLNAAAYHSVYNLGFNCAGARRAALCCACCAVLHGMCGPGVAGLLGCQESWPRAANKLRGWGRAQARGLREPLPSYMARRAWLGTGLTRRPAPHCSHPPTPFFPAQRRSTLRCPSGWRWGATRSTASATACPTACSSTCPSSSRVSGRAGW